MLRSVLIGKPSPEIICGIISTRDGKKDDAIIFFSDVSSSLVVLMTTDIGLNVNSNALRNTPSSTQLDYKYIGNALHYCLHSSNRRLTLQLKLKSMKTYSLTLALLTSRI